MRFALFVTSVSVLLPTGLAAQVSPAPPGLAQVELQRSRECVDVLARLDRLDKQLEPFATRSRRLQAIAQAVALEDRASVQPFDAQDSIEVAVRDWFALDAGLAQRYVTQPTPALAAERNAGRETIKATVTRALTEVQSQATAILETNQELAAQAAPCEGAIFVRSAVLEACAGGAGQLCAEAAAPASEARNYRFVDDPTNLWDVQEIRPWSTPRPLRPGQNGQLDGGRTIGFARVGNVVVSVAFTALLRPKEGVTVENAARFQAINDSLGLTFSHPDLVFAPALGVRVALPTPLAGESRYVIHFGQASAPEVVWSGPAATGAVLEATVPLSAAHVLRLQQGQPLSLTALTGSEATSEAPAYSIGIGNVGQAPAVASLLRYMSGQLSADLLQLVRPRSGE